MKPMDAAGLPGAPVVYAESQDEYGDLPSGRSPDGTVWTRWSLSADERAAILDGANIELMISTFGKPLQPLYMRVQGVEVPAEASA